MNKNSQVTRQLRAHKHPTVLSQQATGPTLTSARNVAARWLIFKQVFKLQVLIGAVDSAELFLQLVLVKRGHRCKIRFPATPPSSGKATETRPRCCCGSRGTCSGLNRCTGELQEVKRTSFLLPQLDEGGSIFVNAARRNI